MSALQWYFFLFFFAAVSAYSAAYDVFSHEMIPADEILKQYGNPFGVTSYFGEFSPYPYPVPTPPNGRSDVHGWLILPIASAPTAKIDGVYSTLAWFSHHVPEFFEESPHNFQMMALAALYSTPHIPGVSPYALQIPLPTNGTDSWTLGYEYTITPPPPFSLNDMLERRFYQLNGAVYYGSFDSAQRYAVNLGQLEILSLSTANWLNYSTDNPGPYELTYFSYPVQLLQGEAVGTVGLYLAHTIVSASAPDFDQVVHVNVLVDMCTDAGKEGDITRVLQAPGLQWTIPSRNNSLEAKLLKGDMVKMQTVLSRSMVACQINVVETIHCAVGLGFDKNCN